MASLSNRDEAAGRFLTKHNEIIFFQKAIVVSIYVLENLKH